MKRNRAGRAGCVAVLCCAVHCALAAPLSIAVSGNRFVDGEGHPVQLRGVNYSGYEFAAIQGWSGWDPSGRQAGAHFGPRITSLLEWHANALRLPLNEASWLGYPCVDTDSKLHDPDPARNYRGAVQAVAAEANAAGIYVILDLHWAAPGRTCPMLQSQMADADHSIDFWRSVAETFRDRPGVMFELFNEPFFNFEFRGDAWSFMMTGRDGELTGYPATSNKSNWQRVTQPWKVASYQDLIDAVRGAGATNVVLVGTMMYSRDLSGWLAHRPRDPLDQMAVAWHPYPTDGALWGTPEYAQPAFAPAVYDDIERILAAGIPVVATEIGDRSAHGTQGAPLVTNVTRWADAHQVGVLGYTWDVWYADSGVLIRDGAGTPTDGFGITFREWLRAH